MIKNYREYQEAHIQWIDKIPSHWELKRGKSVFYSAKEINKNGEWNNVLSLTKKGVIRNNIENPVGLVPKSYDTYQLFEKDDLVFKLIDLENIATSRVGLVWEQGIMSPAYIRLRKRHKDGNIKYYYYQYYSWYLQCVYNNLGAGVRQTLTANELLNLNVPVPSEEEQDQIVRYLDWKTTEIDKFIHQKKKQIKKIEELKQARIDEASIHGVNSDRTMNHTGLDWLGEIPAHWGITRLRNNYRLQNGISESGAFFDKGTPFVNYSDVYKNRILPTVFNDVANSTIDQQKTFSVRAGDILFTRTSETIDEIGIASVCLKDVPQAVFSGFLIRARAFNDRLMPEYMGLYLQSQSVRNYFTKEMNLVIRASLGQNLLKSLYIPVPPKEEQKRIVEYLEKTLANLNTMIKSIENEIGLLMEFRTRIISDAVTGQIDVRDVVIPDYDRTTDLDDVDIEENMDDEE